MPANYVLLEKITVGAAGAASVTFSGIPQTGYTDLVLKYSARADASGNYQSMAMAFNGGSPASAFSQRWINGNGVSTASGNYGANTTLYPSYVPAASATASTFGNGEIYITNYSSTSQYKSVSVDAVTETNATDARAELDAMLWSSNNAVTSITLYGNTNFTQYSTFYLYGVAKLGTTPAIVPYATGGDTIMTDGTYWYHAFLSSGTFTPTKGLSCDVLVVAGGGGGGGQNIGGGGGAGGLLYSATQSLATTGYTVTIGAGGAGSTSLSAKGTNGSNSQFGSITASVGGGGGGSSLSGPGASGGSGGGGSNAAGSTGGAATSGQGYAGGTSDDNTMYPAGGGGGAGAVGTNGNGTNNARAGGAGLNTWSTWASVTGTGSSGYYAGGGAGGALYSGGGTLITTRSNGGGGFNSTTASDTNGLANTGSGGAGFSYNGGATTYPAGQGGSGIVVVRYAV